MVIATGNVHIVCSIAENLAGETCVASLDAGTPVCIQVTKQSNNGQTYAETLAYLEILSPDEVLLNEGRKNSPLAQKIVDFFGGASSSAASTAASMQVSKRHSRNRKGKSRKRAFSANASTYSDARTSSQQEAHDSHQDVEAASETTTVVKFISRGCFDQTKGAELLRRIARKETYDATVVEEYTLLASSHALLHHVQHNIGAGFAPNCLDLVINSGGQNRMSIDRSTLLQLELLVNAKTGKTKHSLIDTIDNTKTSVGSRLLRSNLMAPPCRPCTIQARLDLVDTFLGNEDFFYAVMEKLKSFPDIDKVLANIVIVPRMPTAKASLKKPSSPSSKQTAVEPPHAMERLTTRGIAALVSIKTALSALPAFATTLQEYLEVLEQHERNQGTEQSNASPDGQVDQTDNDSAARHTTAGQSCQSSLLIGLGAGPPSKSSPHKHLLLRAILFTLQQPALGEILEAVEDIFTGSTNYNRDAQKMRHQVCFALRSSENGLIDVLRNNFIANVDDIHKKADEYAELHGFHVGVRYSTKRGYYLVVPPETASTLPAIFMMPSKHGRLLACTTEEVQSLNIRVFDNVRDILAITYDKIQEVLGIARKKYDAMAALADSIALLDMCHSIADTVSLSKDPWTRPVIIDWDDDATSADTAGTRLIIQGGRYGVNVPTLATSAETPFEVIPNDTYVPNDKHHTIISGINGSGKSTYIKQVGIITILAHCGSYVPAEQASVPTWTRLCARIGNGDDQENNISSFMMEMKETGFLCRNSDERTLVLIDELGRATSNEDGVAIAWSVLEHLMKQKATTFFVTHYQQVCHMSSVYSAVQNQHLEARIATDGEIGGVTYSHKLRLGPCGAASNYGVHIAACCGWPSQLLLHAREAEAELLTKLPVDGFCAQPVSDETHAFQHELKDVIQRLAVLVENEESLVSLKAKLQELRSSISIPDNNSLAFLVPAGTTTDNTGD